MIRILFALVVLYVLSGCANMTDFGSPDVYQRSDVQRVGSIEEVTVMRVRNITIQSSGDSSGLISLVTAGASAFLGSQVIGNGNGRYIAAAVSGAGAGFIAQHVGAALSRTAGLEIVVRKANGSMVVVTQPDDQRFKPGDQVLLVSSSSGVRVTH
ncbi:outer membrane lipoprotein [Paraburkholderia oxyphila]|uniref:outer membrane lipoprotein n=1 Tax=Paraburkholderia oxyphila TaxID=614212 RepID=UPI00048178C8|nr:membrane protein [Paraburkholderia oxyphila]